MKTDLNRCRKELMKIPGVGGKISLYFIDIGIKSIADLRKKNPETLYRKMCKIHGYEVDRCMLYVFHCAVYFAKTKNPNPEKLKWWYWKDK
ncbi:DUF4332 domain-containing protein [Candidatus Omnitrophota bacterium]